MVILLLSNSPSYSIPAFFVFSPAVFRVSPQLKSSNFQYAYIGKTKFQTGSEIRYKIIHQTYVSELAVMTIKKPGRPRMSARRIRGITGASVFSIAALSEIATVSLCISNQYPHF